VLEFGCGTGTTALALAAHAHEIIATDISSKMVSIAQEKAAAQGVANVVFCQAILEAPPPHQISIDVVMAFNFFHLLPDLSSAFARIFEMLPAGGLFISKTPCLGEYGVAMRLMIPVLRLVGQAPFVNFVKKGALLRAVQEAGFLIVETGLYPEKSHSLFIVARKPYSS
jgi:ubiquinone/menaquinone biosynthesis C-methylase UbiE